MNRNMYSLSILLLSTCLLCSCAVSGAENPQETELLSETDNLICDTIPETTVPADEPESLSISYEILDGYNIPFHHASNNSNEVYQIATYDEFCALYNGDIPDSPGLNEAFFEDHALIHITFACPDPCAVSLGNLTQDEQGDYHLAIGVYTPEYIHSITVYYCRTLIVNKKLENDAVIVLDTTGHVLTYEEFHEMLRNNK